MQPDGDVIPLIEEGLSVSTRTVETGRVRVRTVVDERTEYARADLFRDIVEVERVAIGREVTVIPAVREEGDTMIVPVVEEVLVIEKRLILKEEVRLTRVRTSQAFEEPVSLRSTRALIERDSSNIDPQEKTP